MRQRTVPWLASIALLLPACSGSSGGSSSVFQLPRISVSDNAVWKVNQEIVFTFSDAVDFSTVSSNTINIQTTTGEPATGTFFLRSAKEVVFQPNCPTLADLSDTGLRAGGVDYRLTVLGKSSGAANTVRSTSGAELEVTQVRDFSTPTSTEPREAFLDTGQGPPVPVVRDQGSSDEDATYMEIGGDPDDRVYFELDSNQNLVLSVPGFEVPLDLYADPATGVAFVIAFNQAVHPAATNISSNRLRLEFEASAGVWEELPTRVTLVANCTETGARVRLEPIGILPQATRVRAVVLAGFQDLVGDTGQSSIDNRAVAPTVTVDFTSLSPADLQSDEFPESFDFGGTSPLSFQDTEALFAAPSAAWEDGRLTAAFAFQGTGGPGGDFDWLVRDGETVLLDTDQGVIVADDDVTAQVVEDGIVDVRNMTIELGGTVRVQGSNPLVINATGDVIIRGTLDVSGFDARDVVQVNTGNVVEPGGVPGPGGGRGGNANEIVTNSTSRGSYGQGPLNEVNGGGQGGESGFAAASLGKDARRPGGGAGGRFALDQGAGLTAGNGSPGNELATGAESGAIPPAGGSLGLGPFVDGIANNFFGTKPLGTTANVTGLVRGELPSLWGGYGGGGGGNALPSGQFPTPNWTPASDEKGGAGGGGGGALHIRALGKIVFGDMGTIKSNGGRGGIGENTQQQDHIGGNGGSGSGGHVILETASYIDFTDGNPNSLQTSRDWIAAIGGPQIQGATTAFPNVSWGGAGGPGVIQLHVPEPLTEPDNEPANSDIVVPTPVDGANALDNIASPKAEALIPAYGARSIARSDWISIGAADEKPLGAPALVKFRFQGIQTAAGADEGKILTTGGEVTPLDALLDEDLEGNPNATVLADRLTLQLEGSSLDPFAVVPADGISNDIYLRNPALLEDFVLRLSVATESQDYGVASARYDEGAAGLGDELLRLTVADDGIDLQDFITANTGLGTIHYVLIPRHFRVLTGGVENALPSTAFVRIRFQAARDDGFGEPDDPPLVDWTGDISRFNLLAPNDLQFFRFEVEFDLAASGGSVTSDTPLISLDFLKIPFVF